METKQNQTTSGQPPVAAKSKKWAAWPVGIVISFLLFFGLIFGSMYFMLQEDVGLVSEDYYADEVAFQEHIDRNKNTHQMGKTPEFDIDRTLGLMTIGFQVDSLIQADPTGTILFFRPSNAGLDQEMAVAVDPSGRMLIPLSMLKRGYWRVRIEWSEGETAFYHEEEIIV